MSANDGGTAFPWRRIEPQENGTEREVFDSGMSLRDVFAAAALQGTLADIRNTELMHERNDLKNQTESIAMLARLSYKIADAMLAERAK